MRKLLILFILLSSTAYAGLDFDGSDEYVNVPASSSLNNLPQQGGSGMTIAMWARWDGHVTGGTAYPVFVDKYTDASQGWIFGIFESGTNNRLRWFEDFTSGNKQKVSLEAVTVGEWALYSVTVDNSLNATGVHIYKNATEYTYTTSQAGIGTRESDAGNPIRVGARSTTSGECDLQVEDLAIWNKVLSAAQIGDLYRAKLKGLPLQIENANLKLYMMFDECPDQASCGAGTVIVDYSGNGNNGTVNTSTTDYPNGTANARMSLAQ